MNDLELVRMGPCDEMVIYDENSPEESEISALEDDDLDLSDASDNKTVLD